MWLLKNHRTKRLSHEARILIYLKKKGKYGAFNYELASPEIGGLSWHRRITTLRKDGHSIPRVHIGGGVWKYFWVRNED